MHSHALLTQLHTDGIHLGLKELIAYRTLTHLVNLSPNKRATHALAGQYLAPHKGRGMEFAEVRQYQQGDDVRTIDWRVSARTGITHTKLFHEEKERPVFIVNDFGPTMLFGSSLLLKSVQGAHLASLLAFAAAKRGDRIGAFCMNPRMHREMKPQSRERGALNALHHIMDVHEDALSLQQSPSQFNTDYFNAHLQRLNLCVAPGALVYLISDFNHLDDTGMRHLSRLSRHNEVCCVRVSDPFEEHLAKSDAHIDIDTPNGSASLALNDTKFRSTYQTWRQGHLTKVTNLLKRAGASYFEVSAHQPLSAQLTKGGRR